MTHYFVVSPEISETIPITDDGFGPTEYFCCVASIDAANKSAARKLAIKHPDMQKWVEEARLNDANPFVGLAVNNAQCKHGKCMCDMCREECDECYKEAAAASTNIQEM